MTKSEFKSQYIVNFLSSWCVANYDRACATGNQKMLSSPPVEDAEHLADEAWEELKAHDIVRVKTRSAISIIAEFIVDVEAVGAEQVSEDWPDLFATYSRAKSKHREAFYYET